VSQISLGLVTTLEHRAIFCFFKGQIIIFSFQKEARKLAKNMEHLVLAWEILLFAGNFAGNSFPLKSEFTHILP